MADRNLYPAPGGERARRKPGRQPVADLRRGQGGREGRRQGGGAARERAAIAEGNERYSGAWGRVSEADVAAAKVTSVWVYRSRVVDDPVTVYRFEALKVISTETELVVHAQGWAAVSEARALNLVDAVVGPDSLEFFPQGLPGAIPLGVLRIDRDHVWVLEDHHGETTDFILEAVNSRGTRRLITTDGGGC